MFFNDRFAGFCVKLVACTGAMASMIAALAVFVAAGNETLSDNLLAFGICMMVLCPIWALTSFFAMNCTSPSNWFARTCGCTAGKWIGCYVLLGALIEIVLFSIMVADLAVPECDENAINLFPCNPDDKQRALPLAATHVGLQAAVILAIAAGVHVHKMYTAGRYKSMFVKAERDVSSNGGDNLDAMSTRAQVPLDDDDPPPNNRPAVSMTTDEISFKPF